jgi:HAD superfamily hydrolase (TIGR01509 family)
MNASRIEAFIFDMDGTLIDSETVWPRLVGEFFASHVPNWSQEKYLALTGLDENNTYRMLVQFGARLTRAEFDAVCSEAGYRIYKYEVSLFPGVRELLAELTLRTCKIALATCSPRRWADIVLDRFQLRPFFHAVATADDIQRSKPSPDIFLLAAERLQVKPANCVVVEDSLNGIAAAKAAGMYCVAVPYTYPRERLTQADDVANLLDMCQGKWQLF